MGDAGILNLAYDGESGGWIYWNPYRVEGPDSQASGELPVTAEGHRSRVIITTHPAGTTVSPIGVTRDGIVYELFFTALPASGFTAADVLKLAPPIVAASRRSSLMRIVSRTVIGGVPTRRMARRFGKSFPNGCGICAKN